MIKILWPVMSNAALYSRRAISSLNPCTMHRINGITYLQDILRLNVTSLSEDRSSNLPRSKKAHLRSPSPLFSPDLLATGLGSSLKIYGQPMLSDNAALVNKFVLCVCTSGITLSIRIYYRYDQNKATVWLSKFKQLSNGRDTNRNTSISSPKCLLTGRILAEDLRCLNQVLLWIFDPFPFIVIEFMTCKLIVAGFI